MLLENKVAIVTGEAGELVLRLLKLLLKREQRSFCVQADRRPRTPRLAN